MENLFAECAPLTFQLISTLCGVREGEHAGNRTYLSYRGLNPDTVDSADEMAGAEQGWAEDDDWQDEIESGRGPQTANDALSPLQTTSHVDQAMAPGRKVLRIPQQRRKRPGYSAARTYGNGTWELEGNGTWEQKKDGGEKRRRPRRTRNRAMIATTVLAQILHARN